MSDWRSIPLQNVDWYACGVSRRSGHILSRMTKVPYRGPHDRPLPDNFPNPENGGRGDWSGMTLGEFADKGERWWRRHGHNIGDVVKEVIRRTIDMAAEGQRVTIIEDGKAPDAYVPRCEREA